MSHPYWLDEPLIVGKKNIPLSGQICIIGSGLSGVSAAYWLIKKGYEGVVLIDFQPESAATFRNCGHILYGTVESMHALSVIHGEDTAKRLWSLSVDVCHEVRDTILSLGIDCDYVQNGYLTMAINEAENQEIKHSISLLNKHGFHSEYWDVQYLESLGFRGVFGGRYEAGSAQAHPTKFRNGLLRYCLERGLTYCSGVKVENVYEGNGCVFVAAEGFAQGLIYDAAIIAANAYSPLLSSFFTRHNLIEPFRGQIITSKPLKKKLPLSIPHSFDHGYEYALVTPDNRLMIGGWRNHSTTKEVGLYDITPNPFIESGLKEFVKAHYSIDEEIEWEYSWAGIMAASKTGFPFIGPTDSQRIFTCSGYTGHGFSWAHGSAKILADIVNGDPIPSIVLEKFNPRKV